MTTSKLRLCIVVMVLGAFVAGCKTASRSDLPPLIISPEELGKSIADYPELKNFPVIDIHSHTFNARYLPIRNIARSRRYDTLPLWLGYLLPDDLVVFLGDAIVRRSHLSDTNADAWLPELKAPELLEMKAVENAVAAERENIIRELLQPEFRKLDALDDRESEMKRPASLSMKKIDKAARRLFGDKHTAGVDQMQKMQDAEIPESAVWRFIYFLTRNERESRQQMAEREFSEIDLFVHHLMDLGPVYGQKPDGKRFIDFSAAQVPRVHVFDQRSNGKFVHFAAFSPFRAQTDHGIDFEAAWKPVEEALAQGAWG